MNKILGLIFFFIILSSCSFHKGKFWTNEKKLQDDENTFKSITVEKEIIVKEFNKNFKISLDKSNLKINNFSKLNNDDGLILFDNKLEKITKYNFSKIKNYDLFDPSIVFNNKNVIFFDNKGTILNFDENSKLIWKLNIYSKDEKKTGPLITLSKTKNILIAADNFAKIYAIDINNGKILWSQKNKTPFNSQIKIYKDKLFIIDISNNLNCYSLMNGDKIWSYSTEKSFINSFKKLSIIIKNQFLVFNNSLGDITAINTNDGTLLWQLSTQNSQLFEDIMNLKTSEIIENEGSIYFSNNKGQFFSIDLKSGAINWMQNIISDLKPGIVGNLIFTISLDGYFFIIDKQNGNILRIVNIFNQTKINKKRKVYPTGFVFNHKDLYITTSNGRLIITNIKTGKIKNVLKIDNEKISRPFVKNQNMYLIRNNSILKLY